MCTSSHPATSTSTRRSDFIYREEAEPHAKRRAEILKKYPGIKTLYGPEWRTKYIVAATVALQVGMAVLVREWSWFWFVVAAYVVGATANHSLFLAIHELSHGLGAKAAWGSKVQGLLANLPIGAPYCMAFKPHHMYHHRNQGTHEHDADIPTAAEGWLISTTATCYLDHCVRKALFMFFQIAAYAFRPLILNPNLLPPANWLALNWVVQFSFDAALVYAFGPMTMLYFGLSTFFAGSIHPTAGHFISEHYVMDGKAETYSYYGPLNYLTYNVGYHNEHHDFPNVAWSNLPKVRAMAPEYYNDLPQCSSWPGVIARYIFDDSISPFSRVKKSSSKKAQ
jgi:sphingolipid delta-4 desaturase